MGDRFGRTYYQSAADFTIPCARISDEPVLPGCDPASGELQRDRLGDSRWRKKLMRIPERFPRSPRKPKRKKRWRNWRCCRTAMRRGYNSVATDSTAAPASYGSSAAMRRPHSGASPLADRDRGKIPREADSRGCQRDATRVTIDLGDSVQYTSGRIANRSASFSICTQSG